VVCIQTQEKDFVKLDVALLTLGNSHFLSEPIYHTVTKKTPPGQELLSSVGKRASDLKHLILINSVEAYRRTSVRREWMKKSDMTMRVRN